MEENGKAMKTFDPEQSFGEEGAADGHNLMVTTTASVAKKDFR